jgi:hypothetical protein
LGEEKSLVTLRDEAVMVFSSARVEGVAPWIVIVVSKELVELVLTALMKTVLPSAVRVAIASR